MDRRLLACLALVTGSQAHAGPLTPADLMSLSIIGDADVSRDGRWLVWSQADTPAPAPTPTPTPTPRAGTRRDLWRLDLSEPSSRPERLDLGVGGAAAPAFAPDGSLYFLATPAGAAQGLYRLRPGATKPTTALAIPVAGYRLSPVGQSLLVWADRPPHAQSLAEGPAGKGNPSGARIYDRLPVRLWDSWSDGSRSQLFLVPMRDGHAVGEGCALAPSLVGDVPAKPGSDPSAIAWSPDGRSIYFSLREAGRIEPLSTNSDLYRSPAACRGVPVDLTVANKAADALPVVSPDGRWLAWAASARAGYPDDRKTIWLRNVATGAARPLTAGWDRSVDALRWATDSRSLYATASDELDHPLFRVSIATGMVRRLTGAGHVAIVAPLADGSVVVAKDGLLAPPDFWRLRPDGSLRRLTSVNAGRLAGIDWPRVIRFSFDGAAHDRVQGLVLRPPGLRDGEKAPAALIVHGGPQATLGDGWLARWPLNLAVYASHGYGVVSIDFHGSLGHGQAFTDSVDQDWGGKPLLDLKLGLADALSRFTFLDGTDACAVGASYGGYMMNWIEGHWPNRFKCLVQHDGIFDERGMTYETDELAPDRWDFGGRPYHDDPAPYEKWNPVNAVAAWKTPQLVITGERDFRSPSGQAIGAFTALQERNIPSRLLVFPDEGHYEASAADALQWYDQALQWMDRWTFRRGTIERPGAR